MRAIVDSARRGRCPGLSQGLREAWKRFFAAMARRTPESQESASESAGNIDAFYEGARRAADRNGHHLPDLEELYRDLRVLHLRKMVMSNANARFAAGDHPRLESETQRFMKDTGLCILAIRFPTSGLVVGSHGLTILDGWLGTRLGAPGWMPIAHDVAVGASAHPDREMLTVLDGGIEGELRPPNRSLHCCKPRTPCSVTPGSHSPSLRAPFLRLAKQFPISLSNSHGFTLQLWFARMLRLPSLKVSHHPVKPLRVSSNLIQGLIVLDKPAA